MEKEKRLTIGKINGIDIAAVKNESGEIYVPIKPICDALGIAVQSQLTKIKEDEIFSSTITLSVIVGADGKNREMACLPMKHICGWLYTINPKNVAPEARNAVIRYREECNDLLTSYFFGSSLRQTEANQAEIRILEELNELLSQDKSIKCQIKEAKERLSKIRAARLDDQPSIFDI